MRGSFLTNENKKTKIKFWVGNKYFYTVKVFVFNEFQIETQSYVNFLTDIMMKHDEFLGTKACLFIRSTSS